MPVTIETKEREIACQLARALERYDEQSAEMVRTWLDMELYAEVSKGVDEMRGYCASLPRLSVAWVEFLIAHSELVFSLWRSGSRPSRSCPELEACVGKHTAALGHLRQGCARLLRGG
ncbi:hypothetical protein JJB11_01705 [Ramlibacter ginsenosidimutans]|uniref:Uncharacterized protein n=1 Tax=Ramlibacter ginsenosidimutans TaxID=502333 RepID=A0A934TQH4_9BURK|nr:hypothetical protein [Ramlibacter ginsenosidimutans]MBK6004792.1 hypothetical protein [Ramlibacter ginsenosidimutans]